MFCPLAIDWGNAADWASAIASFCAVVAALWIAFGQERNARKLRQIAKNEEHARAAHLIGEVIRLTAEIEAFANAGAMFADKGGGKNSGLVSHSQDIESARAQLSALQHYPQSDPRIFGEIGRIIRESALPADFLASSISFQGTVCRGVAERLGSRRAILAQLLSSSS